MTGERGWKTAAVVAAVMFCASETQAQTGTWHGSLDVQGNALPIVFCLDGGKATVDSPAQGVKGIPASVSRPAPDSLEVRVPMIGASFRGRHDAGKIKGTFIQRGFQLPLVLEPGEWTAHRPQTPAPPFPYNEEEVVFSNGGAVLSGTLTLPDGYDANSPALVMVTGSGLQNRDEEIAGHKPFAVIADALARAGIVSLRYDDRGCGQSTGNATGCTAEDLKNDTLSGIELLRSRFNKVGVLGHSEGGTIALMLGAGKDVDFAISLAGMAVSGRETLLDQNRRMLPAAGYDLRTVDEYCSLLELIFDGDKSASPRIEQSRLPVELKRNLQAVVRQVATPHMQHLLNTDPRAFLDEVVCPVLALNGTKDTQVACEANLDALRRGLPSNPATRIMALEGLNHLFQTCATGEVSEYSLLEETFSPTALRLLPVWINEIFR